jgi:sugar lactone lactonase YvrE
VEPPAASPVAAAPAAEAPAAENENAAADANAVSEEPTHRQTTIIQANVEGQPQTSITSFCLTPDDRILAGCAGESGEIRVFDKEGKFVETWSIPVKPDAIYARADGTIFLAGEGQVVQLSKTGRILLQKEAPHAADLNANPQQLREQILAQAKQRADMMSRQTKQFDDMIARSDKEIASLKEQLAALKGANDSDAANQPAAAAARAKARQTQLERRIAMHEQRKTQYEAVKAQWAQIAQQNPPAELTEEQIDAQVKASLAQTMKVSSISATDDEVYLATRMAVGYGFQIWKTDDQFENAKSIVTELRGCCGQMEVKANANGVYVAENSRHRVCRYDREGTLVTAWGESARNGLEGFGSCCNPMNVAFGPDDAVYTAEDNTGRIKRYSPDGKLLGLVGNVDLVPGCKNCSISVNHDGSQVYMLDITRNHIVRMDEKPAGEKTPAAEGDKTASLDVNGG